MKLTRPERLLLTNQYLILEKLYPEEAEAYAEERKIVENGYELHYDEIAMNVYDDTMGSSACEEVLDILRMYQQLQQSFKQLDDKSGIEEHDLKFSGFDGNDPEETKYLGYARFFCNKRHGGRYEEVVKGTDFNSHSLMLPYYRRLIAKWKKILQTKGALDRYLTKEEILTIIK